MTLKTIGTLATTTLSGAQFSSDPNALSNADFATMANGIWAWYGAQGNKVGQIIPGALSRDGILTAGDVMLIKLGKLFTGNWICTDQFGTPFFIPRRSLPTVTTLSGTPISGSASITMASSVIVAGWMVGTHITGTDIPANTVIGTISASGLVITMQNTSGVAVTATGSPGSVTITAGTFTHS